MKETARRKNHKEMEKTWTEVGEENEMKLKY